uniref:Glycosyl transferase family 1 n=2 Tax=Candidatus Bipolaricaulota TaxID=67810 RepID=H5SG75_9BACT|nr:glycosyl transferase family 1 [uncultured Acetothermia bacterium]BAL60200.1 glycosyl transferase family 1 [Candidatus Acetothermum autotrophicum]
MTTVHPPFDTRIFYKEAKTLAQAGYDVTLIARHGKNEVVDGIKIVALPKPKNRFIRIFGITWQALLLALREKAVIYHLHDPELLPVGVLLKVLTRNKVIYDVHEDVPQDILTKHWIPTFLRPSFAMIFNILEKLLARAMDAVVVVTEEIAKKFARFNPIIVHNYPDLKMLPNSPPSPRKEAEKIIIYIGDISKLRGAYEMVRALEHLAHINGLRLDLIGRFTPPELEIELQALAGYQRVRYLGWLSWVEAWQHVQSAAIGLVLFHPAPNHNRALPNKLFEYMAAGLPVIASNFPFWKEIVEDNGCGLTVDPLNPKEIAQAIEYLLDHPEVRQKMGENGRRAVLEKYNWENEAKKLLTLYRTLLKAETRDL